MMEHVRTDTLHDLLDGELRPEREREVREHLACCGACREALDGLAQAVASLGALPRAASPPARVWEGIRARLEARTPGAPDDAGHPAGRARDGGQDPRVVPLHPDRPVEAGGRSGAGRVSLSLVQLSAAAAVVAFLSAGSVWMALRGGAAAPPPAPVAEAPSTAGAAARAASTGQAGYDDAVGELEVLVARGRGVLAPATLATLEESLASVDAALADVRRALDEDPESDLLLRMLVGHQTTKLRVLRQAATAIEARS